MVEPEVTTRLESDGNPQQQLVAASFTPDGEIKEIAGDLALVVQSAQASKDFIKNKQWNLLWRDADLLFQAPRPMTVYENTYVLEPNVQRFTVAKIVNSIVPQLYKGLFYDDPPMVLRPRPGVSQVITNAKTALFSYIFDKCKFKTETKWGLETMSHLGTGIWKYGYDWVEVKTKKRSAAVLKEKVGPDENPQTYSIPEDKPPIITEKSRTIAIPFFEHRPLDKVFVDPKLDVPDIREAKWVIDVRYMDFYDIKRLQDSLDAASKEDKDVKKGWYFPENLKDVWASPTLARKESNIDVEQDVYMKGAVHHAQDTNVGMVPDPLRRKLEILEYWDAGRKILVLNGEKVLYTGTNEFGVVPFLSACWWRRPKSFYGMGLGLIIGQNQRVDQGTINAILKILSYAVNPTYLKRRDLNNMTQTVRTGIGRVISVDGEPKDAFPLLPTPSVPGDVWNALKESQTSSESASGADQQLVQGSSAGPRSSMGRTSGGAAIQASASATRLDGPLDNFIEQVFKPFMYIMDDLVFKYMRDADIKHILGDVLGTPLIKDLDMQQFFDSVMDFEILAGASMSAKRTMAQSMTMLTQFLDNPELINSLADINGEYIDFKTIFDMWMEASEWKNNADIIKPMTPEMKQKRDANSAAAQSAQKMQAMQQSANQKFQQKQEMEDQQANNRIKRDLVIASAKASGLSEAVEGEPSTGGLQGELPTVE